MWTSKGVFGGPQKWSWCLQIRKNTRKEIWASKATKGEADFRDLQKIKGGGIKTHTNAKILVTGPDSQWKWWSISWWPGIATPRWGSRIILKPRLACGSCSIITPWITLSQRRPSSRVKIRRSSSRLGLRVEGGTGLTIIYGFGKLK